MQKARAATGGGGREIKQLPFCFMHHCRPLCLKKIRATLALALMIYAAEEEPTYSSSFPRHQPHGTDEPG